MFLWSSKEAFLGTPVTKNLQSDDIETTTLETKPWKTWQSSRTPTNNVPSLGDVKFVGDLYSKPNIEDFILYDRNPSVAPRDI